MEWLFTHNKSASAFSTAPNARPRTCSERISAGRYTYNTDLLRHILVKPSRMAKPVAKKVRSRLLREGSISRNSVASLPRDLKESICNGFISLYCLGADLLRDWRVVGPPSESLQAGRQRDGLRACACRRNHWRFVCASGPVLGLDRRLARASPRPSAPSVVSGLRPVCAS